MTWTSTCCFTGGFCPPRDKSSHYGKLAVLHDKLEKHVILGIAAEAAQLGFTWSAENPAFGAFPRKRHIRPFLKAPYRHIITNHCAYEWIYMKPTIFIMSPDLQWRPRGGHDGLCMRQHGCKFGTQVEGRWRHTYAIAQQSYRGYSTTKMGRARAKNHIPIALLTEMIAAAHQARCQKC